MTTTLTNTPHIHPLISDSTLASDAALIRKYVLADYDRPLLHPHALRNANLGEPGLLNTCVRSKPICTA